MGGGTMQLLNNAVSQRLDRILQFKQYDLQFLLQFRKMILNVFQKRLQCDTIQKYDGFPLPAQMNWLLQGWNGRGFQLTAPHVPNQGSDADC